jgi:hypothetical protein
VKFYDDVWRYIIKRRVLKYWILVLGSIPMILRQEKWWYMMVLSGIVTSIPILLQQVKRWYVMVLSGNFTSIWIRLRQEKSLYVMIWSGILTSIGIMLQQKKLGYVIIWSGICPYNSNYHLIYEKMIYNYLQMFFNYDKVKQLHVVELSNVLSISWINYNKQKEDTLWYFRYYHLQLK